MSLLNKLKVLLCGEKLEPIQDRFLKYYQPELIKGKQELFQQPNLQPWAQTSWDPNFGKGSTTSQK